MTQEEIIMRHRLNLLLLAKSIKNISKACGNTEYQEQSITSTYTGI